MRERSYSRFILGILWRIEKEVTTLKGKLITTETKNTFKVAKSNLPVKVGFWTKVRNVLLSEIKVELTPYQQKVEDEINEFLHQEITWEKVHDFLFQEVTFGKNNK